MLKKIIGVILIFCFGMAYSQNIKSVENNAFQRGEKLKYRIYFQSVLTGKLTAGKAILEIKKNTPVIQGRKCYNIGLTGKTSGFIHMFYKVEDSFESYVDEQSIVPWLFMNHIRENKYEHHDTIRFNHFKKTAKTKKKLIKNVPESVQDLISVLYYARTFDLENMEIGESFSLPLVVDDTVYSSSIQYAGLTEIKTKAGTFDAILLKPRVVKGGIFNDPDAVKLWVSKDENKVPLMIEANITLGKIKMELINYSGLRYPLKKKK